MPIYTYHCENCDHQFDKRQSFDDEALIVCPVCRKHELRKVYSPAKVVFKGSGFYVTDKRAPSSTAKGAPPKKKTADTKTKKEKVSKAKKPSTTHAKSS
jgi:putative FmdB family regulatory protein